MNGTISRHLLIHTASQTETLQLGRRTFEIPSTYWVSTMEAGSTIALLIVKLYLHAIHHITRIKRSAREFLNSSPSAFVNKSLCLLSRHQLLRGDGSNMFSRVLILVMSKRSPPPVRHIRPLGRRVLGDLCSVCPSSGGCAQHSLLAVAVKPRQPAVDPPAPETLGTMTCRAPAAAAGAAHATA